VGLGAWWLYLGLAMLWRRTVWQRAGESIRAVAANGGQVRALWFGYAVESGDKTVQWFGGIRGAATVVRPDGGRRIRRPGWLDPEAVERELGG